jgi:hypothetical protein
MDNPENVGYTIRTLVLILIFMHTNFIPLDTEIVLCIILVLQGDNEIVGMLHKLAYRHYSTHVHMGDRLLIVFVVFYFSIDKHLVLIKAIDLIKSR